MKIARNLQSNARLAERTKHPHTNLSEAALSFFCYIFMGKLQIEVRQWAAQRGRSRAEMSCYLQSAAEYAKELGQ